MKNKCGFVAIIGVPNSGKSTLLNQIIGSKISITTNKVQTTRNIIRGILVKDNTQIIFIDTPGIFSPQKNLERAMVTAAWEGASEADLIMLIVDSGRPAIEKNLQIIEKITKDKKKAILILNKIDLIKPSKLLILADKLNQTKCFSAIFMISALKNERVNDVVSYLQNEMPEGPFLYPEDQISDLPTRLFACEITREKLFILLKEELPYSLSIETEAWQEEKKSIKIHQVIYVQKDGQKKIIIGKKGGLIKKAGIMAREDLAEILEKKIHLFLHVKVKSEINEAIYLGKI